MPDAAARDAIRKLSDAGRVANEGRLAEALALYDRVIAEHSMLAEAHFNRAIVLQRLGRIDDAERGLQSALRLKPRMTEALIALGRVAFHRLRYREAEDWFQRAVDTNPKSVEAICNLGIAQSRQMHP